MASLVNEVHEMIPAVELGKHFTNALTILPVVFPLLPQEKKQWLMAIRQRSSLTGNHTHIHSGTGSMYIPSTYCLFSTVGIYYMYKGSKG